MYDRKKQKGSIGYAKLKYGKRLKFKKCLDLPYHLSYPCIYIYNENIYMLPECYQSEQVALYKCISFPDKWVQERTLLHKFAVDTTPIEIDGKLSYFTTLFKATDERINDNLFLLTDENVKELKKSDFCTRSAGLIFHHKNKRIRPVQDCRHEYGCGLIFSQIDTLTKTEFAEHIIYSVYPPSSILSDDINRIKLDKTVNRKWAGVHTYNFNDKYEIIDLKYYDGKNIYAFIRNIKQYLRLKFF